MPGARGAVVVFGAWRGARVTSVVCRGADILWLMTERKQDHVVMGGRRIPNGDVPYRPGGFLFTPASLPAWIVVAEEKQCFS